MKIVLMVPEMDVGGVEQGTFDLAQGLTDAGNTVFVFTAGGKLLTTLIKRGVKIILIPFHKKNPATLAYSLLRTRIIFSRIKPDIVHARSRVPAWIGYYASFGLQGTHFITGFHSYYNRHWPSKIMGRGERVLSVSHALAEYASEYFRVGNRVRVVYNGVFVDHFIKEKHDDIVRVGMLSRCGQGKGFGCFIEIINILKKKFPSVEGLIGLGIPSAGSGNFIEKLKKMIGAKGLTGSIAILVNPRKEEFYKKIDIYVAPFTQPEGFGRVIVESQLCGIPVVVSSLGASREVVLDGKTGFLVKPEPLAFIEPLERLIQNQNLRKIMGEDGRKWASAKFSVGQMVEKTLEVYRESMVSQN